MKAGYHGKGSLIEMKALDIAGLGAAEVRFVHGDVDQFAVVAEAFGYESCLLEGALGDEESVLH